MKAKTILLILLFAANTLSAQQGMKETRRIVSVYTNSPQRIIQLFDSLRTVRFADEFVLDMAQCEAYGDLAMYRLAIECGERALASDSLQSNILYRITQTKMLANAYMMLNDYPQALLLVHDILKHKDKIPKQQANRIIAEMLFTIGKVKYKMGDKPSAYNYFEQSKSLLKASHNASELALYSFFLGEETTTRLDDGNTKNALRLCQEREGVIARIDSLGGAPKGYTDQQRAYLYAKSAYVCILMNQQQQAAGYYKKFLATQASRRTFEGSFITPYLIQSNQPAAALTYLLPMAAAHQVQDTINLNYRTTLSDIEKCYSAQHNYPVALSYKKREMDVTDSLALREKHTETIQMNMLYETEQRKAVIATQTAQIERQRLWLIIVGLLLLFLLTTGAILWMNHVKKQRRNEKRYRQIMEQETLRVRKKRDAQSDELFDRLESVMLEKRLYTNPHLERDELCRILGTNATYLSVAIKQNKELTILGYINSVRLDYAKNLLANADKFDIEQVAINSGFGSSRTLHRQFKNVLDLTPQEFFKLSKKI